MKPTKNGPENIGGDGNRADRERFLMRYADSLLRGDLEAQERLAAQAEAVGDPYLAEALWEMHVALGQEMIAEAEQEASLADERDSAMVRDLAAASFPGRLLARPEDARAFQTDAQAAEMAELTQIPPVTVGDVAASIRAEVARGQAELLPAPQRAAALSDLRRLEQSDEALPERVTPRAVRTLLSRLGADVGGWLERQFHEAAAHLTLGRSSSAAAMRFAAARRVREAPPRHAQTTAASEVPTSADAEEEKQGNA